MPILPRVVVLFVFLLGFAVVEAREHRQEAVMARVSDLAAVLSDGYSAYYAEFTHVAFGHISGNRSGDAVALFSVEGFGKSNMHYQYLAVFSLVEIVDPEASDTIQMYRLIAFAQVGGKSVRSFLGDTLRVEGNAIRLEGRSYGEADPACCPSVPLSSVFHVRDGQIVAGDG